MSNENLKMYQIGTFNTFFVEILYLVSYTFILIEVIQNKKKRKLNSGSCEWSYNDVHIKIFPTLFTLGTQYGIFFLDLV